MCAYITERVQHFQWFPYMDRWQAPYLGHSDLIPPYSSCPRACLKSGGGGVKAYQRIKINVYGLTFTLKVSGIFLSQGFGHESVRLYETTIFLVPPYRSTVTQDCVSVSYLHLLSCNRLAST